MSRKFEILNFVIILFVAVQLHAQVDVDKVVSYDFTIQNKVECTEVKSQDRTGTCWSFATASFLESEMIRKGNGVHDLSEMFVVRNIYRDKAKNYVLRQGKANFSQGSLAHDLIRVAKKHGIVPESVYSGKLDGAEKHNHSEMEAVLKGMLDGVLKQKSLSKKWPVAFDCVVDTYLGEVAEEFAYNGKTYTPMTFASEMDINPDDYVNITSYTHQPYYEPFVLEIPDNYSNGSFYNVPIAELESIVDNAIKNGFSVAWDGDVSEKGFSAKNGMAILPKDEKREDLFTNPAEELTVTQQMRQETFESYSTTDDHLMHLTGIARDQKGTKYYLIKNSWGEISDYKGYLHMSEAYFELKTVAVLVHKDAIPKAIAKKLAL
ncbi:MAG: bleomycin hydrolase [Saprospiraceae bacterium]|jgi:bleomycin hydrolase